MLCACGFKYTPLWIQGLKRLVLWIQTLTLLVDQGLWTQVFVLHLSCAKAASDMTPEMITQSLRNIILTLFMCQELDLTQQKEASRLRYA